MQVRSNNSSVNISLLPVEVYEGPAKNLSTAVLLHLTGRDALSTSCRTDGSRNNAIPNANAERFIISISAFLLCLSRIQLIIIVQLVFVVSTEVGTGSIDENFDATLPCNNNAKANLRPESHCI